MRNLLIVMAFLITSCSYIKKADIHKQSINKDSIDYIEIQKPSNDSLFYRFNDKQVDSFVKEWNNSKELGVCNFIPDFRIKVHLNTGKIRDFRTNLLTIKEKPDYCYAVSDSNYFGKLWAESMCYESVNKYVKTTKDKFLENIGKLEDGLRFEIIDLYQDSETISEYHNLFIGNYLIKNGFKETNFGFGNWFLGPIIECQTLENDKFICKVDKLYYSQDSSKVLKITERIECIVKK